MNLKRHCSQPKKSWIKIIKQMSWDLRNIKALCKVLKNPQKNFESIHIVGTNGKGSTAFYLANILTAHKIKTGLFTSPHLVSVTERFKIDGKNISQKEFNSLYKRIKSLGIEASYFEVLTAMAFVWFAEQGVQVAVLEAGLGGRLDSTKVARGNIVALTNADLDHTELLGNTREKILKEKLGIAKKNAVIITRRKKIIPELKVGNFGKIYVKNAELACAIAKKYLPVFNEDLARKALKNSFWLGRMQIIDDKIILDGAHNPAAARVLSQCLKEMRMPALPCIFASLIDKDTYGVLKILKPHISVCYPVLASDERARSVENIARICEQLKIKTLPVKGSAKSFAKRLNGKVLVTGSLYLIGEFLV